MVKMLCQTGALILLIAGLSGCGSTETATNLTPEQRFARAKELFDKGDYLEAINQFTVITLQYQGSTFAGDAQFYLGESRFERGEYLLAAFEYGLVKRNFPASPRVPDAQYKLALSYYKMSPKSSLDQQYTRKAIDEFQSFVEYYPSNPKAADASEKIRELTTRLAKKQYETAQLYTAMEYYRSALLSYDVVIEKYHDTEYAPLAYLGKADLLMSRGRYSEAKKEIDAFLQHYPNSVFRGKAESLQQRVEKELRSSQSSGPRDSAGAHEGGTRGGSEMAGGGAK
jgi:outer membrane protein assembly factor BamD